MVADGCFIYFPIYFCLFHKLLLLFRNFGNFIFSNMVVTGMTAKKQQQQIYVQTRGRKDKTNKKNLPRTTSNLL